MTGVAHASCIASPATAVPAARPATSQRGPALPAAAALRPNAACSAQHTTQRRGHAAICGAANFDAMPQIDIIASDIDGTLLNSKQELTEGVASAVQQAAKLGVPVRFLQTDCYTAVSYARLCLSELGAQLCRNISNHIEASRLTRRWSVKGRHLRLVPGALLVCNPQQRFAGVSCIC